MNADDSQVPCSTCGAATINTGTKRCNACWEVESRLEDYLRRGGVNAQDFVRKLLLTSLARKPDTGIESKMGVEGKSESPIKRWLTEYAKLLDDTHIRPEIQALVKRGNITPDDLKELRCNSWEWEAMIPVLTEEAFLMRMEHALANCGAHRHPLASYNEAVEDAYAPELLRRYKLVSRDARNFADTIDGVRGALGQEATHFLVVAGDVKDLVDAVERCADDGGCRAMTVLHRLRESTPKEGSLRGQVGFVPRWQDNLEVKVACHYCAYALPATDESGQDGFNVPVSCVRCGRSDWRVRMT